MKKTIGFFLLIAVSLIASKNLHAQKTVTLSGYVKDAANGEELIGANIFIDSLRVGTSTNEYGFYSLSLQPGTYTISYLFIGFKTREEIVVLDKNISLNIELNSDSETIGDVVLTDKKKEQNITGVEMSVTKIDVSTIKNIPQVLGETDVIRSILLLPGVTNVGEGASGFNVRGGNVDQNLILLDEAPVYNSSHLFGFFSVFNADALKDVTLYKGGMPAKYGGRLSSVLDVRQKDGNMKRFGTNGGIGLLSSRLTLEGPIQKDKSSFMIAGRRSYADLFLRLSSDESLNSNVLYFYDLNAKANYKFSDKDRLYLSGYFGRDVFKFDELFGFSWGNTTGTLRWNHLFNDKFFSNFSLVVSDYKYSLGAEDPENEFDWESRILNQNLKADFTYYKDPRNTFEFGVSGLFYNFEPANVTGVNVNDFELENQIAIEPSVYISHEHHFSDQLKIQYGVRYSHFLRMGAGTVYEYDPNQPKDPTTVINTITYEDGDVIKDFGGFEPRLLVNYIINKKSSVKASYNRTRQYIHLISNTTSATPIDVWRPSDTHINPATADQVALGYFRNFKDNTYELSAEVYYKTMNDIVEYKDGADLLLNQQLETDLITGDARSYGLELMLKKQEGKFTGWISYTLSRSERKVQSRFDEETINDGNYYPSNFDKLHDLSIVMSYEFNKKWSIGSSFAFTTGRPITLPTGKYQWGGFTIADFSADRNGDRIDNYHRLDVSATYKVPQKEGKRWQSSWSFGVYNLYSRRNTYSLTFRQNEENPLVGEAVKISIFGSAIPFVTYNFNF